jgi:hypothetical protein
MSDPSGPLLSVRGEARLTVAPDCVLLAGAIESSRDSKAEALRAASASLDGLTADLAALGGVALGAATQRRPLTWSAQSATTYAERDHNKKTGRHEPTGQVIAMVSVMITVRALGTLAGALLVCCGALAVSVAATSKRSLPGDGGDAPAVPGVSDDRREIHPREFVPTSQREPS